MVDRVKPAATLLAAAAFAGAATLILQGAVEQQHKDRDFVYRELFYGARLIIVFILIVLSFLAPSRILPNVAALAATVALRYIDLASFRSEVAAVAGSAVILVEAFALMLTCTASC